jgi:hypothetical protein
MFAKFLVSKIAAISATIMIFASAWAYVAEAGWRDSGPHLSVAQARAIEDFENAAAWQRLAAVAPPEPVTIENEPTVIYQTVYVTRYVYADGSTPPSAPAGAAAPPPGQQAVVPVAQPTSATKPKDSSPAPSQPPASSAPPPRPSNPAPPPSAPAPKAPTTKTKGS